MNIKRLQQSIEKIATFTEEGDGINRLAYTELEREARDYMIKQFEQEGMEVRVDVAGNVIAKRNGLNKDLPAVAVGSHIDSIYDAGKYDGVAGVMAALEAIRTLNERKIETLHPIEVIIFACEESSRFGISTLGSKAMAGLIKAEDVQAFHDKHDVTLVQAFEESGLDLFEIEQAKRTKNEFKSFIELHIEQGPVLEKEQLDVGVVSAIAAPIRFRIKLEGMSSHSGTTPMEYRQDAFLGAAEIALEIERAAKLESDKGTVGTVGVMQIQPGGMNIVPGFARMDIDIRGTDLESRRKVVAALENKLREVVKERNLTYTKKELTNEEPVDMDTEMIASLTELCKQNNITYKVMPSGAGHDAMNMATLCPTGMIFIPSKDGISHNPQEYTAIEQIGKGATLLYECMLKYAHCIEHIHRADGF